jgi:dipeptidyl-peptidase-3
MFDPRCNTPVHISDLHVENYLPNLTPQQLKYATYLSLATWAGFPLILSQSSREGPAILKFLLTLLNQYPRAKLEASVSDPNSPIFLLLEFASLFFTNSSNYLSLGDKKFIPRVPRADLTAAVAAYPDISAALSACADDLYSVDPNVLTFGWPPSGVTAYYHPADFTEEEQKGVDALLQAADIRNENTIIFRESDRYEVKRMCIDIDTKGITVGTFQNLPVIVTKGLYSDVITKMVRWLALARDNALNPTQAEMLTALITHWEHGEVSDHVKYSEFWVRDVDPPIEHHHGFIESYRDPSGVRCEYECFVATLNDPESKFLHTLVAASDKVLPLMPYPKEYERSNFNPPSYNAINILTIVTSFLPQGINIPNYDSVRLNLGFKNVSCTNVIAALAETGGATDFLSPSIVPLFQKLFLPTRVLNISLHELFGHGSGTLLAESDVVGKAVPDIFNPGKTIDTFWKPGETWQNLFGDVASSYEECRAETTALHLGLKDLLLDMYGVSAEEKADFRLIFILNLLCQGLQTLTLFHVESGKWKQAHAQGRFAIIKALLKWSNGAVAVANTDGKLTITVDPAKIDGVAEGTALLLKYLNYYKTTAKVVEGRAFYEELTSFDEFWMKAREVSANGFKPRPALVGAVIRKKGEEYTLERWADHAANALDVALVAAQNIGLSLA